MTTTLRPAIARALAAALLIAVLGGAWNFAVMPVWRAFEDSELRIRQAEEALRRYELLGQGGEALEAQVADLRARSTARRTLLQGDSEALAAAGLQTRLKTLVEKHGGELKSTQALPGRDDGHLRRVTVRTVMTAEIEPVRAILHEIEAGTPFLFVESLDLRSRAVRRRMEEDNGPRTLEVRLDVHGFMQRGAP